MPGPAEDLAQRLTASGEGLAALVTKVELDALRRYQALDRMYAVVNELLRGERGPASLNDDEVEVVRAIVTGLDRLLDRWTTPEPLLAYRGQRSLISAFDLVEGGERPDVGTVLETSGFLSTTIHREVALLEFATPPGAGGPALLEIEIPAGAPALWVPPLGDPALAYQGELLLPRGTSIGVRGHRAEAGILVIDCEVVL